MRPQYNWKLISIGFWSIVLIILVTLPVYGMELSIGESHYSYSGQALVPIHLKVEKGESPTCASLDLQYNPNLITFQKIQIEKNLIQQGKIIQAQEIRPGLVRILIYGLNENSLSSGNIAIAYFQHQNILLAGTTSLKINQAIGVTGKANKLPVQTKAARLNLNSGPAPIDALNNNKFSLNLLLLLIVNIFILSNLKGQRSLGTPYPKVFGRRWVDWCNLKTRDRPAPFLTCLPPPSGADGSNCVKPTKCRPSNPPLKPSTSLRNSTLNIITKRLNKLIRFYIFVALILSLQWFILPQASMFAATYYVDALNGDDANPGTSELPWKTLGRAYTWYSGTGAKVQEGDTVLFRNGSYGTFRENTSSGGSAQHYHRTNWITYKADNGHTPALNNIDVKNSYYDNGESYLVFDGFQIDDGADFLYTNYIKVLNCKITNQGRGISGYFAPYYKQDLDYSIFVREVNDVDIENNEVSYTSTAAHIKGPSERVTVKNNTVHRLANNGLFVGASHSLVEENLIYDINARRCDVPCHGTVNGTFIVGETIVQDNTEGVVASASGSWVNIWITNNDILRTASEDGRSIVGQKSGATLSNVDIVDRVHIDGIEIQFADGTDITVKNNRLLLATSGGKWGGNQGLKLASYWPAYLAGVVVQNNLIAAGKPVLMSSVHNGVFVNNTFLGDGDFRIYHDGITTLDSVYNNIFACYFNIDTDSGEKYTEIATHGNNIFKDNPDGSGGPSYPFSINSTELVNYDIANLFVDPINDDYRLKEGSVAIDFGDPAYAPATDIDGNLRDSKPDAGCYEYGAQPLKGDVNKDGRVNIQDVQACVNHILGKQD